MREIKFRGKCNEIGNEQWVFGDLVKDRYPVFIHLNPPLILDKNGAWECDPKTIGQYTGLKDKNGKEIFEGDFIRYNDELHKIYFDKKTAQYTSKTCWLWTIADNGIVVGNIHDSKPPML